MVSFVLSVKVGINFDSSNCDTLPDVRVVSVLVGDVGHDLDSAVGECDAVFTLGLVAIPHLVVREVIPGVVVFHAVSKGVVAWALKFVQNVICSFSHYVARESILLSRNGLAGEVVQHVEQAGLAFIPRSRNLHVKVDRLLRREVSDK